MIAELAMENELLERAHPAHGGREALSGDGALQPARDPSRGLEVGMGANSSYGTIDASSTFDPRQVELRRRIRF